MFRVEKAGSKKSSFSSVIVKFSITSIFLIFSCFKRFNFIQPWDPSFIPSISVLPEILPSLGWLVFQPKGSIRRLSKRGLKKKLRLAIAMAPHSSTPGWKIPWTEEPGKLQSMGSLRVGHNWATSVSLFTFIHWRRKWQPAAVFLPGESQGQRSLVGCRLWGHSESDTTEVT